MTDTPPTVLTEDILGEFGFRVVWSYQPHWTDVKVYSIESREGIEGGAPLFERKDAKHSQDTVTEIADAEVYLEGYLKWDGCNELDQGDHHFCGVDQIIKHCMLLQYLWRRAHELMDASDCKEEQVH